MYAEELTLLYGVQARRSSPGADDQIQSKLGLDLVHNGKCTSKSCRSRLYSGHYHEGCRALQYLSMNRTTMLNVNQIHFDHASLRYEEFRYHLETNVLDLYFCGISFVILHKGEVAEVSVDHLFCPTYSRARILLWISWAKTEIGIALQGLFSFAYSHCTVTVSSLSYVARTSFTHDPGLKSTEPHVSAKTGIL